VKLNRRWWLCLSIELLACLLMGCGPSTAKSKLPTTPMTIGSKTFTLEIAATQDAREFGLMRRDSMPPDHGMIFVFQTPQKLPFWMKNTRIPLDIIYVDEQGKVDSVKQMQPYVETPVSSEGAVKWAIELNQGAAATAGVKAGDVLTIPDAAKVAKE
jgi:uncharacterized membrane protein (UPF0127 family)